MQTIFRLAVFLVFLSASFLCASCSRGSGDSNAVSEEADVEGIYWNTSGGGDLHFFIVRHGQDYEIDVTQYDGEIVLKTITLDSSTEDVYNLVDDIFHERHDIKSDTFTPSGETGTWTSITLIYSNINCVTVKNISSTSILNTIYEFVTDHLICKTETPDPYKLDPTPANDASEFEMMALCVSGELLPPDDLTSILHDDITGIRSLAFDEESFSEPVPQTDISFSPPWAPGKIGIYFDDESQGVVVLGKYNTWDGLNEKYHAGKIDIHTFLSVSATIEFNDKAVHPERIAEDYNNLAGVTSACAKRIIGDRSNIYPYIPGYQDGQLICEGLRDKTRYYLFRKGDEDCPSGCIINDYWLFKADAEGIELLGDYHTTIEEIPQKPSWWPTAQRALDLYRSY
jgi:hypothetical protein